MAILSISILTTILLIMIKAIVEIPLSITKTILTAQIFY
jgi:hypothetical protein